MYKLPEGYEYNEAGNVVEVADRPHIVSVRKYPGAFVINTEHEDMDLPGKISTDVALALIRNAGLDPVYTAASVFAALAMTLDQNDPQMQETMTAAALKVIGAVAVTLC